MKFTELVSRVQDRISDSSTSTQSIIQDKINETLEEIWREVPTAKWYYREAGFDTVAQVTGSVADSKTVQVAQGERMVKFTTAAAIGKMYIGADFKISGDDDSYRIEDVGLPNVVPTIDLDGAGVSDGDLELYAILDRPYTGTSDSDAVYTITQDLYALRSDVNYLDSIRDHDFPTSMIGVEPSIMRWDWPDPNNFGATGNPTIESNWGRRNLVWISDYSSTDGATGASAAVTVNSHTVTLSSLHADHDAGDKMYGVTTADEGLIGLAFRVKGIDAQYIISRPEDSSGLVLQLEDRYAGSTNSDTTFEVGQFDAPLVQLYAIPTDQRRISYGYYQKERVPLRGDEDRPILPSEYHGVLLDGSIWRMLRDLESSESGMTQTQYVSYQRGMQRIRRSQSLDTKRYRRMARTSRYLERRYYNLGGNYGPYPRRV